MNKGYKYEDIEIKLYEPQYREALKDFKLNERQQIYSSLPLEVLDDAINDTERRANVVINDQDEVVGFFVLHKHYQHEGYDTPENVVYIRSLSINEAFQGHGYGTKIMMNLPEYVQTLFPDFNHLYLVVDAENEAAWNVYERAGFMHTATKEEGPIGKERLYYLDLNRDYVSSLKLKPANEDVPASFDIIDLMLNNEKVGFIAIERNDERIIVRSFDVYNEAHKHEISENALRQIATYTRKHYKNVSIIEITLFGSDNELTKICQKSNFVEIEQNEDYIIFEKYINY